MINSKILDVVIVGAGPAGSLLAYLLARRRFSVMLIEKESVPRRKVCGGGITRRALDLLPFDVYSVVEDFADTAILSVNNHTVFSKTYDYPITAMVMRDRFDHYLIKKAADAGAWVKDKTTFVGLSQDRDRLTINTSEGKLTSRTIVGADGASSCVADSLNLIVRNKQMTAVEARVFFKQPDSVMDRYRHRIHMDYGHVPKGYGWIFPKKDHLSVGLLSVSEKLKGFKTCLRDFLKNKKLDNQIASVSLKGSKIPYRPSVGNRYASRNGLLVGDATGISDPITGEGIYYALRGAQLASDVISASMINGSSMMEYDRMIKTELFPEIRFARRLAGILYGYERFSHRALQVHGPSIAENHIHIITGKKSYGHLRREVLTLRGLRTMLAIK